MKAPRWSGGLSIFCPQISFRLQNKVGQSPNSGAANENSSISPINLSIPTHPRHRPVYGGCTGGARVSPPANLGPRQPLPHRAEALKSPSQARKFRLFLKIRNQTVQPRETAWLFRLIHRKPRRDINILSPRNFYAALLFSCRNRLSGVTLNVPQWITGPTRCRKGPSGPARAEAGVVRPYRPSKPVQAGARKTSSPSGQREFRLRVGLMQTGRGFGSGPMPKVSSRLKAKASGLWGSNPAMQGPRLSTWRLFNLFRRAEWQ